MATTKFARSMDTARRRTAVLATASIALAALLLSGCGNIDAGSGAADDFEEFMNAQEHVIDATGRGTNDFPWRGSPSGGVTVRDDISAGDLEEVVTMVGEYYVDHDRGNLDWKRMDVTIGGFRLDVEKSRSTNDDLRALFEVIRDNPFYAGGDIGLTNIQLEVVGTPSAGALAAALDTSYRELAPHFVEYEDIEGSPALGDVISVYFADAQGNDQFTLQQFGADNRPDAEIAAFQALWAGVPLEYARVSEYDFYVQTADEAQVSAAKAVVGALLIGAEEGDIRIMGPQG